MTASNSLARRAAAWLAVLFLAGAALPAQAGLGMVQLPAAPGDGPVTVFYPTDAADLPVDVGPFHLQLAVGSRPEAGNGRLVVVSHGSGAAPWVFSDVARRLTEAGFVVALPEHRGDNWHDTSLRGPKSWALRPAEVSRAIDAVAADPRFGPRLKLDRVGLLGNSAGGHTALTLAGGRWSEALFKRHCVAEMERDLHFCIGLTTRLDGDALDGVKLFLGRMAVRLMFSDETLQSHEDPRIAAVVVGVPAVADFDFASLQQPRVPVAVVTVGHDRWLTPALHAEHLLQVCRACEHLGHLEAAGHAGLVSPPIPGLSGVGLWVLGDPPGYDRAAALPPLYGQMAAWFSRHLLQDSAAPSAQL